MKWFKHPSALRNLRGVAFIIDHGGLEGYGAFCMTCEIIAEQMGKFDLECVQTLSTRRWTLLLGISRLKFQKILTIFAESELCTVTQSEDDDEKVTIAVPMLAKLRDEYSRKSGQSPDTIRTMSPPKEKRREEKKRSDALMEKSQDDVRDAEEVFRGGEGFSHASEIVQMCVRNSQLD